MKDKKSKENIVNESASAYKAKPRIRVFKSFEEAKEYEIQQIIEQDPIERLRNTVNLILRVYGVTREELENIPRDRKITFIKGTFLTGESFG